MKELKMSNYITYDIKISTDDAAREISDYSDEEISHASIGN